jgi:hypothetical protein
MHADPDYIAVEEISRRWMQAWIDQDRATLDSLLTDDYSLIVSTVPTLPFPRGNWLNTAVGPYVCTRYDYEGASFRKISDDVVIMSSVADFDATIEEVDRSGRYFVTDVWRREGGTWKIAQRYSSRPGEVDDSVKKMANEARK